MRGCESAWIATSDGYEARGGVRVAHIAADRVSTDEAWGRMAERRFQRDRDAAATSGYLIRLKDVTQVFFTTRSGVSKRYEHSLEVARIAGLLAQELRLSAALAQAVSFAHDCGHSPFGHQGERVLQRAGVRHGHWAWGAELAQTLGYSKPVSAGVRAHPWSEPLAGYAEAELVSWADRIAYLADDIRDAQQVGLVSPDYRVLGFSPDGLKDELIGAVLTATRRAGFVCIGADAGLLLGAVRRANWETIYCHPAVQVQTGDVEVAITGLLATFRTSGLSRRAALRRIRAMSDSELLTASGKAPGELDVRLLTLDGMRRPLSGRLPGPRPSVGWNAAEVWAGVR